MKKIVAILLTLFLFSVGFNVKQYSDNNNINNKELTAKEEFEKKVTCRQYLKDVEERYKDEEGGELKIYYSPVKNTCISAYYLRHKYWQIIDILNNEELFKESFDSQNSITRQEKINFYNKIDKLIYLKSKIILMPFTVGEEE